MANDRREAEMEVEASTVSGDDFKRDARALGSCGQRKFAASFNLDGCYVGCSSNGS